MEESRRSAVLLFALGFVAAANGLLLGISLYLMLAALIHLFGGHAPGIGWAVLAGAVAAVAILGFSAQLARATRRQRFGAELLDQEFQPDSRLGIRLAELTAATSLPRAPSLRWIEDALPNAFAVGRSREDAAIVLTSNLLERLGEAEQDAVLAHELAHVEAEDLATVGLADAIAVTVEELGRTKDRYLWGPWRIARGIAPFAGVMVLVYVVQIMLVPKSDSGGLTLLWILIVFGLLYWLWKTAIYSWRGLAQFALLVGFFGPLTLIEWVLAPPTAFALSRIVARERVTRADRRGVELTGDVEAMVAALRRLEGIEFVEGETLQRDLRFSLFVTPRAQSGYRAWRERVFSSHPPVAERIRSLEAIPQERSRGAGAGRASPGALEQSG